MEKWCVKPRNKNEARIIGKWFDENWSSGNDNFYENGSKTDIYYIYGIEPGNVYFTTSKYTVLTFDEFQTKILNKSIEPNYEIY